MKKLLIFIAIISTFQLAGQVDTAVMRNYEDTLKVLGHHIVRDTNQLVRMDACRKFIPQLVQALKTPNSFDYTFDSLQQVSIIYPPDSTFRIFTWQLFVDDNEYKYYGAIQMNSPTLELHPLMDKGGELSNLEQRQMDNKAWLGALYYGVHEVKTKKEKYYVLFGFKVNDFFNRRKIGEVLSFKNGKPVFGKPIFEKKKENGETEIKNRLFVDYSAEVVARLNYNENYELILFDNIITMPAGSKERGLMYVPDGSYQGYKLKKGKWIHVEKVFNQTFERPPNTREKETKNIKGE